MLVGRPKVLRKGATTIVIEVELEHRLEQEKNGRSVGITTLGFAILPRRNELQAELHRSRTENSEGSDTIYAPPPGAGLTKPLLEAMAVAFDPQGPGTAQIAVDPYLQNTLGALQGGIVAIFAEATAERFAASVLGAPVRVRGLELQYLKLGKVGPIRARARELGRTASGLIVRVELDDRGEGDALLTVATVWIDRLAPTRRELGHVERTRWFAPARVSKTSRRLQAASRCFTDSLKKNSARARSRVRSSMTKPFSRKFVYRTCGIFRADSSNIARARG